MLDSDPFPAWPLKDFPCLATMNEDLGREQLQKPNATHSGAEGCCRCLLSRLVTEPLAGLQEDTGWASPHPHRICSYLWCHQHSPRIA